jgi:phosphoglycolate phosphatase-like HAD superfamily hydrolase
MHVLALDFDGVICDSSREVFVVAVDTYAVQEPGSNLVGVLAPLREDAVGGGDGFRSDPLYLGFQNLLPLGNRAEDFGVSLRALETGAPIQDQISYDEFYRTLDEDWLAGFHRRFYEARSRLRSENLTGWLKLHLPYPGFAPALRRHVGSTRLAVATAKDVRSVRLLLEELDMADLFETDLILDKQTGVEKTRHLELLCERTGARCADLTFVDDKVNHLVKVSSLGVRPVLAAWGFNTQRELTLARELGFEVAELGTADSVLFKGE